MNDELKSMDQSKVWDIVELLEGYKTIGVNGSSRPSATPMAISNNIKPDLWPSVLTHK
jgi:hypothetical protein